MRTILTLALPALLLLAVPAAQAQTRSQDRMTTGREAEAGDLGPARSLIGKTIVHRYQGGTVGTIREVVTGEDGKQKLVVDLRGSQRQVMLDTSEVDRRGNRIQLMLDPEQVAGLPDYQSQSNVGRTMGTAPGGPMGGSVR